MINKDQVLISLKDQYRPLTIWLTGLSASGKTTIALALKDIFDQQGCVSNILDGDLLRKGLNEDLGFSEKDRNENVRRAAHVAKLFNEAGSICIVAFISPYKAYRQMAKEIIGTVNFLEIYISTPLKNCEQRDPKGLYKKARAGDIKEFTGINAPYEPPDEPALSIDTTDQSIETSTKMVLESYLKFVQAQDFSYSIHPHDENS
jgi:adenylyl-sulfate kinase